VCAIAITGTYVKLAIVADVRFCSCTGVLSGRVEAAAAQVGAADNPFVMRAARGGGSRQP